MAKLKFVRHKLTGRTYVRLERIMAPLVALIDGLPTFHFGDPTIPYLDVDKAIDWCKAESIHHSKEKYDRLIAAMERIKASAVAPKPE